jgi:hypothetical protein
LPDHDRLKRIRQKVIDRDGLLCCYCEKFLLTEEVTMEHIVPVSKRGTYNTTNLTVACSTCNNKRKSIPFFQYCKSYNWSNAKLQKYQRLYDANLKIKVLNIAKEFCIEDPESVVPETIIKSASSILKLQKELDFKKYLEIFDLSLHKTYKRKEIKFSFEKIIQLIEADTF